MKKQLTLGAWARPVTIKRDREEPALEGTPGNQAAASEAASPEPAGSAEGLSEVSPKTKVTVTESEVEAGKTPTEVTPVAEPVAASLPTPPQLGDGEQDIDSIPLPFHPAIHNVTTTEKLNVAELFQRETIHLTSGLEGWPDDAPVPPYEFLSNVLADISSTSSRLETIRHLTLCYAAIMMRAPDSLIPAVYLTLNKIAPAHEGVELGIGDATLIKVVAETCAMTEKNVRAEYQKTGDLAELAQNKKKRQGTLTGAFGGATVKKRLALAHVHKVFRDIALASGKDVQRRRIDAIKGLLRDAQGAEVNFIVRALQGKMRIGVAVTTLLTSLGYALAIKHLITSLRNGAADLKKANPEMVQKCLQFAAEGVSQLFHEVPSFDLVLPEINKRGMAAVIFPKLSLSPGVPVKPMLAHPTTGVTQILDRFQGKNFTCEYKYDGERAQVHYINGKFDIFSRNSESHTAKYPDVISFMPSTFDPETVHSFILDSEVVAIDKETGGLKSFQVLQGRGRKNVNIHEIDVPVCLFAFDILFLNGKPTIHLTLRERREVLKKYFAANAQFRYAQALDSNDTDEMQAFLQQSIVDGCEGLMVKTLDEEAKYTPFKRSYHWLKLKKDYMEGCGDTLDLVPIGGYHGKGKRAGVFGGYLLACYDPVSEEYQSVCKIGTGFTDEALETLANVLNPYQITNPPRHYCTNIPHTPDVWFSEQFVWEVRAADLTISPVHCAAKGMVDQTKGIALRFPRFIRVREDKAPTDATSAAQIADMYRSQALQQQQQPGAEEEDDDYL